MTLEDLDSRLGDYSLQSIEWTNGGIDLNLKLISPRQEVLTLRFVWVCALKIDFDFGRYAGSPLVFEAHFERRPDSMWKIDFQFGVAPEGNLAFQCNEVELA